MLTSLNKKLCSYVTLFGLEIQDYKARFCEFSDICRPPVCPICGRDHPLHLHGTYPRLVYDSDSDWQEIRLLRYYCHGCGRTVSILPEFLTPYKRYALKEISRVFYLYFVINLSLCVIWRSLLTAALSTICAWIRDWGYTCKHLILRGFAEAGIISSEDHFPGGDCGQWAFTVCDRYVFPGGLCCVTINCGEYALSGDGQICERQQCRDILPKTQLRLQELSPPLWPLRNL